MSFASSVPFNAEQLLRVSGLCMDYTAANGNTVHALRGVDFAMGEQECIGVLGESGSGKSSLAQAMLRLLPSNAHITSGDVLFRGQSLMSARRGELRRIRGAEIALISQEPALALNPVLTVGRQIQDVLQAHFPMDEAQCQEKATAMLRDVGFDDPERVLRAYPHQLSGGEKQRAAITQALICAPKLLIADEPLSSLDAVTQSEVLRLLQRLQRELKLAMLFVTHDAGVLAALANKMIVMRAGEVVASGRFDELSKHADPYVRGLMKPEAALADAAPRKIRPERDAAATPLLEIAGLTRNFEQRGFFSSRKFSVRALDGVDLNLHEGESVAVIGRSGSGKSTLARCIAGFERADSGHILLQGAPQNVSKPWPRRDVQMIFQDAGTALNPLFTAAEIVYEPLSVARQGTELERRQLAVHLMEEVGLDPDWYRRRAGEFSGGQRQRLALARALAAQPKLLVLDEAFSGLDLPLQGQMLRLLLDLQSRHGLTYLFITHDLNFVTLFAREVLVMDAGRIVERIAPQRMRESSEPATQMLVRAAERLHAPGVEVMA